MSQNVQENAIVHIPCNAATRLFTFFSQMPTGFSSPGITITRHQDSANPFPKCTPREPLQCLSQKVLLSARLLLRKEDKQLAPTVSIGYQLAFKLEALVL